MCIKYPHFSTDSSTCFDVQPTYLSGKSYQIRQFLIYGVLYVAHSWITAESKLKTVGRATPLAVSALSDHRSLYWQLVERHHWQCQHYLTTDRCTDSWSSDTTGSVSTIWPQISVLTIGRATPLAVSALSDHRSLTTVLKYWSSDITGSVSTIWPQITVLTVGRATSLAVSALSDHRSLTTVLTGGRTTCLLYTSPSPRD